MQAGSTGPGEGSSIIPFTGQGANSQSGGILPTDVPSGQSLASMVQATPFGFPGVFGRGEALFR